MSTTCHVVSKSRQLLCLRISWDNDRRSSQSYYVGAASMGGLSLSPPGSNRGSSCGSSSSPRRSYGFGGLSSEFDVAGRQCHILANSVPLRRFQVPSNCSEAKQNKIAIHQGYDEEDDRGGDVYNDKKLMKNYDNEESDKNDDFVNEQDDKRACPRLVVLTVRLVRTASWIARIGNPSGVSPMMT
ncbi:hypothetical protein NX059_009270 [Plenodomus lindquistii]|nr:hypothetical protein NX059_009270 [Plenodomus lindquistii]